MIRPFGAAFLALLVAACATPTRKPVTVLASLPASWEVRGRLAVTAGEQAWHGRFAWRHAPGYQHLEFSGPLGQGSARLEETEDGATLDLGSGRVLRGTDTRALLETHFGWSLPLEGLGHWIAGRLDPTRSGSRHVDAAGRVTGLVQDGWEIALDRYRAVEGGALPHRAALVRDRLEVRLVLDDWRFGLPAEPG